MDEQLNALRQQIDTLDETLLQTLQKRFDLVRQIGTYKKQKHMPIVDHERFNVLIAKRQHMGITKHISTDFIKKLFSLIHSESIEIEREMHE